MSIRSTRRDWLRQATILSAAGAGLGLSAGSAGAARDPRWSEAITKGLNWLRRTQSSRGQWNTQVYPTALAALSGTALIGSGSTTTQGPYARQIARTADFLISKSRDNGLIGDPQTDSRYTYGHGFSMLFLSQVLGEEGLLDRREELVDVLTRAVEFSGNAQTAAGGWGYVSARDGNDFDEGSTTITQVQGFAAVATQGSRSAPKSSIAPKNTFMAARIPTGESVIAADKKAVADLPSPPPRWPHFTTPATTTANTFRKC